jgi:hypothetical protein
MCTFLPHRVAEFRGRDALPSTPRTDPDEPNSSIRLLPWVCDGEAQIRPRMKDARRGEPAVGQFRHARPREAVLLATPPERASP